MTNLLVVDDEENLLEALAVILTDTGYQVEAVTSGQAALDILRTPGRQQPDLIIADIVMPEMTGLQLFEIVRGSLGLNDIPFLFASAFVSSEVEDEIGKQRKASILRKPFEVDDLLQTIKTICQSD
ncbi:MAG: response regulator [Anaerolineae bacterium]|nr:response regulator [Anaerolineae bacterium]